MILSCLLTVIFIAQAAPHPQTARVEALLERPSNQRFAAVKAMGQEGLNSLESVAFNKQLPMETRWKSLTLLAQLAKKPGPHIDKALRSSQWFMRSAGLTALESLDMKKAKSWARYQLQKDPALMVRMKAFEVLAKEPDDKTLDLFWQKISSSDSYHHKKSLWIRNDLAVALSKHPRKKDLNKWVQLLHDPEQQIQKAAAHVLTKIHGDGSEVEFDLTELKKKYPLTKIL